LWAARGGLGTNWTYGIDISGFSNTTISNLAVQGAYAGIRITVDKYKMGGNNNTVRNCHIQHGLHRILMQGNPAFTNPCTHDNEISFNTFTLNMYGYASPGAYPADKANATDDLALKEWFYWFLKYVVGDSSTADVAIKMGYCGANNCIHNNTFEKGGEGVFTYSCENTQIYSNTFRQLSDCGVLVSDAFQLNFPSTPSGETVQCNTFSDVHQFIRYDRIDVSGGVRTNFHYFLSNTGENDPNLGMIVQFHMAHSDPSPSDPFWCPSTVCRFALTMAGNRFGLTAAVFHFSGYTTTRGGIPTVTISSNSFLSPQTIHWGGGNWSTFIGIAAMVGSFVNNRLVDDMGKPAWYGVGNTKI
jgi:parallel beta-helix repeat protein